MNKYNRQNKYWLRNTVIALVCDMPNFGMSTNMAKDLSISKIYSNIIIQT
jgi:hypothetical protein